MTQLPWHNYDGESADDLFASSYGQFFVNSSNEFAATVVEALRRIVCPSTASITQRAIDALPTGIPLTPESLTAAMEKDDPSRDKRLEECDQAYLDAREDIATALLQYLIKERASIKLLA